MVDSQGDSWEEFQVLHHGLKKWKDITGGQAVEESPYHQSTAAEIDWRRRVELQAIIQKYVTHSISSTINLPPDVTPETIGGIYQYAWEMGLKGITVYREGSRMGVLVSDEPEVQSLPASRPERLESSVLRFMNGSEPWVAFVGLLGGNPYEIFTGKAGDSLNIPPDITHGWILKIKQDGEKSRYDFRYVDQHGKEITIEVLSRTFDPEYWNYAKLISGVLRHGMPLLQVINLVRGLHLSNENINSWKAGVERALAKFIPSGSIPSDRKCPVCGDTEGLIYEEGCIKCTSCGQTQCG
jgi:ribonucleoside-diphosphate reductase alpha chain